MNDAATVTIAKRAGVAALPLLALILLANIAPPQTTSPNPSPIERLCVVGPFIVFFERDGADLTLKAISTLDDAIAAYRNCGVGGDNWTIAGFADRSGRANYNLALSQRRADAVRAYLGAHGIVKRLIATRAFGEDTVHLRVSTPDGVSEDENRRVEITVGPGD